MSGNSHPWHTGVQGCAGVSPLHSQYAYYHPTALSFFYSIAYLLCHSSSINMAILRPATPGFICTLVATILLAVVSFGVPLLKSVYFLKASISEDGYNGTITFGTLGYCLDLSNGTTCSKASVGYELDINSLVGNELPIDIPNVAVKWITYALVLHIVALCLAAISAFFGLLAHVREMSMTCCSTCVSGFAATVALIAFIFDLVLFFVAKARINSVGTASIGTAIWLTLAAWLLLFFSGCFYTIGRCCISKRKPRDEWGRRKDRENGDYDDQMRLDAVKAEADRKAMQQKEIGLSPLPEAQPLTARVDGDNVIVEQPYRDQSASNTLQPGGYGGRPVQGGGYVGGGYVQAPAGSRAVDEYYNPTQTTSYPPQPQPQPRRQGSSNTGYAPSTYAASTYTYAAPEPSSPTHNPPVNNQYLSTHPQQHPDRYGSPVTLGGTTYHSPAAHQQYPSAYSQYDAYDAASSQVHPQAQQQYSDPYGIRNYTTSPPPMSSQPHYYPAPVAVPAQERNYTLGGDGYGQNSLPPLPEHTQEHSYLSYAEPNPQMPSHINTVVPAAAERQTSPMGPRAHMSTSSQQYDDSPPPGYEAGSALIPGGWSGKN
ncbi:pali-domain-containing protein [Guyanagaster necrorhizus]|uniref:Pali-domain-containing protein n=1 Tax=Guyanagaster necrorhizus TaxID=856835 RepID=A0A9P7W4X9_9AGAR|nr:pali-domain-containing protein [Guyanagaster necrorhizus MCA 3950]KAG7452213.1 pali-domain-containing protein [Guyanagaster necrorhizus MCA 3950]